MILRAAWVVPVSTPPIRDGYVAIHGARIAGLGAWRDAAAGHAAGGEPVIDLGAAVLTPGLVNPHTHLELGCYAGALGPSPFWEWIARLITLRRAPGQVQRESASAAHGAWRSLQAGVTCVGDISRRGVSWRALRDVPIRKVCFAELLSIADFPPRDPTELAAALDEIEVDDLLTAGVSPHAPYTVPPAHFAAAVALAQRRNLPWTTHWAETREELAFLGGDAAALPPLLAAAMAGAGIAPPRASPAAYLAGCVGGAQGAIVHGNYLSAVDARELAAAGHILVYCPRAHEFFGHAPYPLAQFLQAGLTIAVGTDSPASNFGYGLLDELHHVWKHHPGAGLTPADIFRMGTTRAAAALKLDDRIGALEAGYCADLAAFDGADADAADPLLELIARPRAPLGVWIGGRRVVG